MAIYMNSLPLSAIADDYSQIMVQRGFANFTPPSRKALRDLGSLRAQYLFCTYSRHRAASDEEWASLTFQHRM